MRWPWPSQRSLRCRSRVYILGRPAGHRTSAPVSHSFFPRNAQDTANASQVDDVESSLLPGLRDAKITTLYKNKGERSAGL